MERKDTTISVQRDTYQDLDELRSPGQSFDGLITELLQKQKTTVEA